MSIVKEEVRKNPFGRPVEQQNDKGFLWKWIDGISIGGIVKFGLGFITVALILVYIINGMFVSSMKNNAVESITEYNKATLEVAGKINDENSLATYRSLKSDNNEDIRIASDNVLKIASDMKEKPVELINVDMNDEEATLSAIRPTVLCDLTEKLNTATGLSRACYNYNNAGINMIREVTAYNTLSSTFSGKIAWTETNKLPNLKAG